MRERHPRAGLAWLDAPDVPSMGPGHDQRVTPRGRRLAEKSHETVVGIHDLLLDLPGRDLAEGTAFGLHGAQASLRDPEKEAQDGRTARPFRAPGGGQLKSKSVLVGSEEKKTELQQLLY